MKQPAILYWHHPERWLAGVVFVFALILIWFRSQPLFELALADSFFTPLSCTNASVSESESSTRCGAFVLKWSPWWNIVRDVGFRIPVIGMILLLAWLFWPPAPLKKKEVASIAAPALGILSVLIGPMLLVNMVMKPVFGRPRPVQVDTFGGDWPYALPGDFSGYCTGNCSFVSGEAASAFWMLWIIPFLPSKWRIPVGVILVIMAVGISLLRMAFGGHFLSDVVMGGLVSALALTASAWFLQSSIGILLLLRFCAVYNWAFKTYRPL